jgi:hypothetical protein
MTKLPVASRALMEAEALAFAREWIARFSQGGNPWSSDPSMSAEASRAFTRHMMQLGLQSAVNRMMVIAWAKAGDADAVDVLRTLLLEYKSRRLVDEMPSELIEYDMWITNRHGGLQRLPARKKKDKIMRNVCIGMTVAALVDHFGHLGLEHTGRSPRRHSACSIVAEALEEARMQLGYKAVERIWDDYSRNAPTVPGWASA